MRREFFQNAAQHTRIMPEKVSVSTTRYVEGVYLRKEMWPKTSCKIAVWILISLQLTHLKLETGCPLLPSRVFHLQEIINWWWLSAGWVEWWPCSRIDLKQNQKLKNYSVNTFYLYNIENIIVRLYVCVSKQIWMRRQVKWVCLSELLRKFPSYQLNVKKVLKAVNIQQKENILHKPEKVKFTLWSTS